MVIDFTGSGDEKKEEEVVKVEGFWAVEERPDGHVTVRDVTIEEFYKGWTLEPGIKPSCSMRGVLLLSEGTKLAVQHDRDGRAVMEAVVNEDGVLHRLLR